MSNTEGRDVQFRVGDHTFTVSNVPVSRMEEGQALHSIQDMSRAGRQVARQIASHPELRTPQGLKFCRRHIPLSGSKFGELCGVNKVSISRWENGHAPIPASAWSILMLLLAQDDPKEAARTILAAPSLESGGSDHMNIAYM